MTWQQHVLPHSQVRQLGPALWYVTGSLPKGSMPRTMVVHRLSGGESGRARLLIHSAVALNDAGMNQLEALGTPSVMIVPNRFHRLDAAVWKERYPELQVLCPEAAAPQVKARVPVDGSCEASLPGYEIVCHATPGIRAGELCYEMACGDGTKALVVTDVLFNLPDLPGLDGKIFKWLGSTGFFGITRIGRLMMMNDRQAFKQWLLDLSRRTDIAHVVVGHGDPLSGNVAEKLKAAAGRL
jgi:hypothetical protein